MRQKACRRSIPTPIRRLLRSAGDEGAGAARASAAIRAIAILGPLEARLQSFDLTILGGLNEGTWPAAASADPWFSRPMREKLGLEQPERSIGLAAHDFAMLAAGRDVLLTRAAESRRRADHRLALAAAPDCN